VRREAGRVNNVHTMARSVYQLRITLAGPEPVVWRRLLVPGGYTLDRLHRCIQLAMGWYDCHLHGFEVDGVQYGPPEPTGELDLVDELDTRLDAVAVKGGHLVYTYDFGDWWEHEILVEDVVPADPRERYPACVAGQRACPPEDIGGLAGYSALVDPAHPRHGTAAEWVGRPYDAEEFDPDRTSTLLRRLA
jgi:hypothetical protein